MNDLIAFLKARLDEDEAAAKYTEDRSEPWRGRWEADENHRLRTYNGWTLAMPGTPDGEFAPGVLAHIARHDPARILREIEAKRQIITRYEFAANQVAVHAVNGNPAESEAWDKIAGALELDVRSLVAVYSDHPDYRPERKL